MKRIIFATTLLFLSLIFFAGTAEAANISVTPDTAIFNVTNAAPGGEYESSLVTVQNTGPDAQNVQFSVDVTTNPANLSSLLYMKTTDETGATCLSNCSYAKNLDETTEILIGPLAAGSTEQYKFVILFDKDADNDFQNAQMVFDLTIGYKGSTVVDNNPDNGGDGDGNDNNNNNGNNDDGTNNNPGGVTGGGTSLVAALAGVAGAVAGEESVPELNGVTPDFFSESGAVLGDVVEETACPAVPWRIFFFILVAYLFLINLNLWHGFNGHPRPRWGWAVGLTALALIGWHYLDRCRTNQWFIYAVVISGFVCYLIYLHYFQKKLMDDESKTVY